jgi:hypothetical protein
MASAADKKLGKFASSYLTQYFPEDLRNNRSNKELILEWYSGQIDKESGILVGEALTYSSEIIEKFPNLENLEDYEDDLQSLKSEQDIDDLQSLKSEEEQMPELESEEDVKTNENVVSPGKEEIVESEEEDPEVKEEIVDVRRQFREARLKFANSSGPPDDPPDGSKYELDKDKKPTPAALNGITVPTFVPVTLLGQTKTIPQLASEATGAAISVAATGVTNPLAKGAAALGGQAIGAAVYNSGYIGQTFEGVKEGALDWANLYKQYRRRGKVPPLDLNKGPTRAQLRSFKPEIPVPNLDLIAGTIHPDHPDRLQKRTQEISEAKWLALNLKFDKNFSFPWQHDKTRLLFSTESDQLTFKINFLRKKLGYVPLSYSIGLVTFREFKGKLEDQQRIKFEKQKKKYENPNITSEMKLSYSQQLSQLEITYALESREKKFQDNFMKWMMGEGPDMEYKDCFWVEDLHEHLQNRSNKWSQFLKGNWAAEQENKIKRDKSWLFEKQEGIRNGLIEMKTTNEIQKDYFWRVLRKTVPKTDEEAYLFYKYVVKGKALDFDMTLFGYYNDDFDLETMKDKRADQWSQDQEMEKFTPQEQAYRSRLKKEKIDKIASEAKEQTRKINKETTKETQLLLEKMKELEKGIGDWSQENQAFITHNGELRFQAESGDVQSFDVSRLGIDLFHVEGNDIPEETRAGISTFIFWDQQMRGLVNEFATTSEFIMTQLGEKGAQYSDALKTVVDSTKETVEIQSKLYAQATGILNSLTKQGLANDRRQAYESLVGLIKTNDDVMKNLENNFAEFGSMMNEDAVIEANDNKELQARLAEIEKRKQTIKSNWYFIKAAAGLLGKQAAKLTWNSLLIGVPLATAAYFQSPTATSAVFAAMASTMANKIPGSQYVIDGVKASGSGLFSSLPEAAQYIVRDHAYENETRVIQESADQFIPGSGTVYRGFYKVKNFFSSFWS